MHSLDFCFEKGEHWLCQWYYKDRKRVVNQRYYHDRERRGVKITPPMLISCLFPCAREGILNLLNHEICCDFTHMLVTEELDLDSNTTPLCGAIREVSAWQI